MFVNSFNGDRSDTSSNFAPATLGSVTDSTYWNTALTGTSAPYSFTPNPPNTSNPASVTITVSGTGGTFPAWTLSFVNTGTLSDNWKIDHIPALGL